MIHKNESICNRMLAIYQALLSAPDIHSFIYHWQQCWEVDASITFILHEVNKGRRG